MGSGILNQIEIFFLHNYGWRSNMLVPLFKKECMNSIFKKPLLVLAMGFGFILKCFFFQLWVRIQHASPLAHKGLCEFWLSYIPIGTGSGVWIHFEIFLLYNCGWGSSILVSLLTRKCVNFGFKKPLLIPAVRFGFILNVFFPNYRWRSNMLVPLFISECVNFGLDIPLPIVAMWFGLILKCFFSQL